MESAGGVFGPALLMGATPRQARTLLEPGLISQTPSTCSRCSCPSRCSEHLNRINVDFRRDLSRFFHFFSEGWRREQVYSAGKYTHLHSHSTHSPGVFYSC